MYYLVQSNIYSDPEHHKIFDILAELNLEYEKIELHNTAELSIKTDRKDIFVYGSVKLARLAKVHTDWTPGSFYGGNHTFKIHSEFYKHHLLNYETDVFEFGEMGVWEAGETKFIKPYTDAKVFTGKVFTEVKWADFVKESLLNPRTPMLHAQTLVQASKPKKILKEARIWIVGETVIDGVYYHFHDSTPFESTVSDDGIAFAKAMVKIFNVADAFVMDIGLTEEQEWKIIEINCINSAGFYHLNPRALFRALEVFF
jgi:ATP-grasp domain, R2K clade family 3